MVAALGTGRGVAVRVWVRWVAERGAGMRSLLGGGGPFAGVGEVVEAMVGGGSDGGWCCDSLGTEVIGGGDIGYQVPGGFAG